MLPRLRVIAAACAATVIVGGVAVTLATRVPDIEDRALAPDNRNYSAVPIDFDSIASTRGGSRTIRIALERTGSTPDLARADVLDILVATYDTGTTLLAAELRAVGGGCVFRTAPGTVMSNNATTRFERVDSCVDSNSGPFVLEVQVGMTGRFGLWVYDVPRTESVEGVFALVRQSSDDRQFVLRGRIVSTRSAEGMQRAALVSYVWTGSTDATALWLGLLVVWGALAGGFVWFVSGQSRLSVIGGSAAVTFAVAALWAVVLPPLQGADEPDHLLSFLEVVGRPGLTGDLESLARRTHFERIRFRVSERLRPEHVDAPAEVAWTDQVHAERTDRRSRLAVLLWRVADATIGHGATTSAAALVLRLRLFNAVVLALAVAAATSLAARGGATRWSLMGLAVIPALVPFGVAVSDWAFVTAGAIVLSGAIALVMTTDGTDWMQGLALGAGLALAVTTNISGLALIPLGATLLCARVAVGPSRPHGLAGTAGFWTGLTVSLACGVWINLDLFALGYARLDQRAAPFLNSVNGVLSTMVSAPWLLLTVPLGGIVLERLMLRLRRHPDVVTAGRRLTWVAGAFLAVAVGGVLAASAFIALPTLAPMEFTPIESAQAYAGQVLLVFTTSLRLTHLDHLTFVSFWSGFGWIDTILPTGLLALLSAGTGLGLASQLVDLLRTRSCRRIVWTIAFLVGTLLSMVTLAYASGVLHRNIHGRYLINLYVPLVVVAWRWWPDLTMREGRVVGRLAAWGLATTLVIVHTLSYHEVLTRHF